MVTTQNWRSMLAATYWGRLKRANAVTTNRNNLNRLRIFSFRAKFQTPTFVSMPSCATMKSNRGVVSGKENRKPLRIQRFQDMQLLPFQQKHSKSRSFFSGLQASEPAA